jgi:D-alanine-D-alanine ligase
MKVGLTFDLRSWYLDRGYSMEDTAEFDQDSTIDALEEALVKMGFQTERVGNVFQLMEQVTAGKRWDMILNIAEGLYGDGRESVIPAILDQYKIPYVFSGPVVLGISLNKYLSRVIMEAAGVPVSPGMLIEKPDDVNKCRLEYPLFIKPVSEGTGKGITEKNLLHSPSELKEMAEFLLKRFEQPALVEEYLPGREFTVGIIGTGEEAYAIGAMEIICKDNLPYSVEFKENYEEFCQYIPIDNKNLEEESKSVALKSWKALGGVDAGRVDVKTDRHGRICFMEVNPLAGLHPVDSDLPILSRLAGIKYQDLIERIVNCTIKRYNLKR